MENLENRLANLWKNPNGLNLHIPLIYQIDVTDDKGRQYSYIGKGRNDARLKEYNRNMLKIAKGRERGKTQNYRAVHFALYKALSEGWEYNCYVLENVEKEELNSRERELRAQFQPNLNGAGSWRVSSMNRTSMETLLG